MGTRCEPHAGPDRLICRWGFPKEFTSALVSLVDLHKEYSEIIGLDFKKKFSTKLLQRILMTLLDLASYSALATIFDRIIAANIMVFMWND